MAPAINLKLKKGEDNTIKKGFPWVYRGQFNETSELQFCPSGSLAEIYAHNGSFLGMAYFNSRTTISARILAKEKTNINEDFFYNKLKAALLKREKKIKVPYYRLVHSEADFLPGLLIDRFGDTLVCQVATAGMENFQDLWLKALERLLNPKTIIFRNDIPSRKIEGLKQEKIVVKGSAQDLTEIVENGAIYLADLLNGQKTGWFYDQRENRRMIADLCLGKTMADIYSHSGGFGIICAKSGAKKVTMVDSSKKALDIAKEAARKNNIKEGNIEYIHESAFIAMKKLREQNVGFDVVVSDPPAFVKAKKDVESGMKGYEKVANLSSHLVNQGGLLFVASCSHHASRKKFNDSVIRGVKAAGRDFEIVKQTGADIDHPIHQSLPQSEYLKGILLRLE